MKKKVAIITILDNNNLGNRLQNYAVQCFFEKIGADVTTLKNHPRTNNASGVKLIRLKEKVIIVVKTIKEFFRLRKWSKRYRLFREFNKKIKYSKKYITYGNASEWINKFDYFSVGSDQVWNPQMGRLSYIERLEFSKKEQNISLAASAAIEKISDIKKVDITNLRDSFINFKKISVREEKTKALIEEMTGRKDIVTIMDPTMLLDKEEWKKIEKRPSYLKNEDFIFVYFLKPDAKPESAKIQIEDYAKERNFTIVDISDKQGEEYQIGPAEFLYLEKHAKMVITDSFHACCFAINFGTPFIVFRREGGKMYSRIETLLQKFKLLDAEYNGEIKEAIYDYGEVEQMLVDERDNIKIMVEQWLN